MMISGWILDDFRMSLILIIPGNEELSRDFSQLDFQLQFLFSLNFLRLQGIVIIIIIIKYNNSHLSYSYYLFQWLIVTTNNLLELWSPQVQDTRHWEMAFGILRWRISSHKVFCWFLIVEDLILWRGFDKREKPKIMKKMSSGGDLTPFSGCYNSQLITGRNISFVL